MTALARYREAIFGALLAGPGAMLAALEDGDLSGTDWVRVATAIVVVLAGVYACRMSPPSRSTDPNLACPYPAPCSRGARAWAFDNLRATPPG